jgi:hypothetical protein
MAALKWTIMLLAFHLMGLFDSKSTTAAPLYSSGESQNSGMSDSTLVDMDGDNITDTHEMNIYNTGNFDDNKDDDGAEKGKDRFSSKDGQETQNERELGGSGYENVKTSSNPHEDADITAATSDEGEHVHHKEALDREVDVAVASSDDQDTGTGAEHDNEVDTDAAHDGEADTDAAHDGEADTDAGHDGEADTDAAHDGEADTDAGHDGEADTDAVHDGEADTDAAHDGEVDTDAGHDGEADTDAAHDGEADTAAAQDNEDTHADRDNEENADAPHNDNEETGVANEGNDDTVVATHEDNGETSAPQDDDKDAGVVNDDQKDTGAAHKDNEDTGEAHEDEVDAGKAHEDEVVVEEVHEDEVDAGKAHEDEVDAGKAHDDEVDAGKAHKDEVDAGKAHKDEADAGEVHEDNDNSVAHNGDVDTGSVRDHEEMTDAAHEDYEAPAVVHEGEVETGAVHDVEEDMGATFEDNDTAESHSNEEDFGIEYVNKDNHIAHDDKEKYTAVSHEAFEGEPTNTSGTNDNNLAPHVHHEDATAGLAHAVIAQHTNGTANASESSQDQKAEGTDTADIHNAQAKPMQHLKKDNATYSHVDYGEREEIEGEEEEDYDVEEEEEEYGNESDYGAKTGNSGVADDSARRWPGKKEDKENDMNSEEGDSNTDTPDTLGGSNKGSSVLESGGSGNRSLNVDRSGQLEENTDATSTDIARYHGAEYDSVSERTEEHNISTLVTGSEDRTVVPGPQLRKEEIKRKDDEDGVNEPGNESQSQNSEYSKSSTGSFVVLGIIMGTIVVLLGYSVFKSRWRNRRESKNEDFGTEMADVKKNLLPRNEFNGGIHPTVCQEADDSKAKLLPDTQDKGNDAQNEETHKVKADVQNQKDGPGDSHPKPQVDYDRIETQSESDATNNTLQESTKSSPEAATARNVEQGTHHPQESRKTPDKTFKSRSEDSSTPSPGGVSPKKAETAGVQSGQHLPEPPNEPENASKTSSQEHTNSIPDVALPQKVDTADVQSVHSSSRQNGYSNVNGIPETQPSVLVHNNGVQVQMPVTRARATIVYTQPCGGVTYQYRY